MPGHQDSHEILSVTDLIETRAKENGDSFAVHTGHSDYGLEFCSLTYAQQLRAVDRLCSQYEWLQPICDSDKIPPQTVVGILNSSSWEITILELALVKLGLCPMMLSVNNSAAAIAHLCQTTSATTLIHGPKFVETAQEARDLLVGRGIKLPWDEEKRFPLWGEGGVDVMAIKPYKARLTPKQENPRAALILHSSGSTGFPKPNYCTHHYMIENAKLSRPYAAYSPLPLYHGFGHNSRLYSFRCMYYAQPFTLFFPHLPLTAENIVQCYEASPKSSPQTFVAVAYVLKLLAETEAGIDMLTKFDIVPFAGAAVPDDIGDLLVSRGVNLMSIFGATETGALFTSDRDFATDKAWNYVRREGWSLDATEMEERGENVYEVIAKAGVTTLIAHNRPDGSYALKDLFMRHPEHESWFKYVGRLDDTLTQTLGEKTNPVPIELTIRNSRYVRECIVFGDGRPQTGCLLRPSEAARDIWKDRANYMDLVWPSIAEANKAAPSHSRIVPEMVEILPIDTKIPVATKMTILRPACYKLFAPFIDEVYARLERGSGQPKLVFDSRSDLETFIRNTINTTLDRKKSCVTVSTDFFAYGVDSLQATMIRNTLIRRLDLCNDIKLSQNIVFEHPSVQKLAGYLWDLKTGVTKPKGKSDHHATMWEMTEKWFHVLNRSSAPATIANGHAQGATILTGATGSLGAHLLDQLTADPAVARVICLSRAKSHDDSLARVKQSLLLRGRSLNPEAATKLTSYSVNMDAPSLGLLHDEYVDLDSATVVIHNAWPVHFGLSLESFEPFIAGTITLMNLASRVEAKFFFSRSMATVLCGQDEVCHESYPTSPASAASTGYGQSKWIVEKLMEMAGKELGLEVGVLRMGQLVGDTKAGIWNETEAWPLLFQSANVVKTLPVLDESLSWLPVDLAARSIKEVVLTRLLASPALYHIVNPHSLSWSTILSGLSLGGLAFTPVERDEWLSQLRSHRDPAVNPAFKLIDFYTGRFSGDSRPGKIVSVEETMRIAPTLRDCRPVTAEMVATWVKHWKTTGFLP